MNDKIKYGIQCSCGCKNWAFSSDPNRAHFVTDDINKAYKELIDSNWPSCWLVQEYNEDK